MSEDTKLNDEEIQLSFSEGAVFANKIILTTSENARLSFMEEDSTGKVHHRTSVVIPLGVALALQELLEKNVSPILEKIKEAHSQNG